MAVVFFSYSHKDEELRDHLETHLSLLKREGIIEAWHDRRIVAGDEFGGSISDELERADIILLLVSPDFIASDYCYDVEMTRAMERYEAGEARVIPIILRPCDWKTAPFGKLQGAPKDARAITQWPDLDEAFLDVVMKIRNAVQTGGRDGKPTASASMEKVTPSQDLPRSSNLRVKKTFTDADNDRFLEEAFSFMSKFFESSLSELEKRNPQLDTSFRQIDANRFTAVIYD